MRLVLRVTAAIVAAVFLLLIATLPPRAAESSGSVAEAIRARTVAGAVHIHSVRSDGAGDREAIAAAAARAGLQFVIITDHGDGTRQPDPPAYLHNVLCIDAVEVSSNGGHVIALDMGAAPYPLGGEADAVIEDVLRLGGMPVAAHPDSPKPELSWKNSDAAIVGFEWLNLDSAWRSASKPRLARVALDALMRPGPGLSRLLERPVPSLARWDALTAGRRVVGLAGHDAHGGVGRSAEGSEWALPGASSYAANFAAFSTRALVSKPFVGDAVADARMVLDALRSGHVFTAIDGIASGAFVDFRAKAGSTDIQMGENALFQAETLLTFRAMAPSDTTTVLLRNGAEISRAAGAELEFTAREPGAYRVEVRRSGVDVPWVVTNPIYLQTSPSPAPRPESGQAGRTVLELTEAGVIEKEAGSSATVSSTADSRTLRFQLREGERVSQYVALAVPLPSGLPTFDAIAFEGSASGPMRVSVQLRFESAGGSRWRHSTYFSAERRSVSVPLARMVPADRPGPLPLAASATSLLFVVDLTNAQPGAAGEFEIRNLRLTEN